MTVRVVPLRSREAGEARVGGTAAERLSLVTMLSEAQWTQTRHPLPTYSRANIPVAFAALRPPASRGGA